MDKKSLEWKSFFWGGFYHVNNFVLLPATRGQKSLTLSNSMTWSDQNCPTKGAYFEMIFLLEKSVKFCDIFINSNFIYFRHNTVYITYYEELLFSLDQIVTQQITTLSLNSWTYTVQPSDSWICTVQSLDRFTSTVQSLDSWTYNVKSSNSCTYTVLYSWQVLSNHQTVEYALSNCRTVEHPLSNHLAVWHTLSNHWTIEHTQSNHPTIGQALSNHWIIGQALSNHWIIGHTLSNHWTAEHKILIFSASLYRHLSKILLKIILVVNIWMDFAVFSKPLLSDIGHFVQ